MDSVEIAIFNKTKRKMFDGNMRFTNVVDYLVFIMQIVEEYSYMLTPEEKQDMTISIGKKLEFGNIKEFDDETLQAILRNVCLASKQKIAVNVKRKRGMFSCMCN